MLTTSGILLAAADYGESSASLGQYTDEYTDLDHVSVISDVVRNATYNAMELNYTSGIGGSEDLTTWTEVDVEGDLEVNSTHVEFTTLRRDSDATIYKDFGVDYFQDFVHNFTLGVNDIEAGDASNVAVMEAYMIGNGPTKDDIVASEGVFVELQQFIATDDRFKFRMMQRKGGAWTIAILDGTVYTVPDVFYCSLYRVGTQLTLDVFSDEARTVRIEHLTSGGADLDKYRYVLASVGYSATGDPADHASGYVSLINLGGVGLGYEASGYFTTTDYLDEANGSILVQLTNTTIPDGTGITVEFSEDNAAWVLNDWAPIFGGFESIDLRDLNYSGGCWIRYNFSTANSAITPRLYQSRLITTEGPEGEGAGDIIIVESDFPWIAIAIILSLISYLLLSTRK